MKPVDNINKSIKKLHIEPTAEMDKRIYNGISKAIKELKQKTPACNKPDVWRIIMNNKMTKLAVAAVIIVAALIGINQFGGSIDITSVALADVAERVGQIKNSVFEKTTTVFSQEHGTQAFDSKVYYSEGALREDIYDNDQLAKQVYVKYTEGIVVGIDRKIKAFNEMNLTDEDVAELSPIGPNNFVNLILSKGKYKKLGRKIVGGVLSEGFEFDDKRGMLSMDKERIENVTMRLWVDINTNLPIRIELDAVMVNGLKAHVDQYDPKLDIELEPDFFEPKIPVNYVNLDRRGLIGINIENWPILKAVPGGAAEKAGVKDGDVVLKVNGNSVSDIKTTADAEIFLLGEIGDKDVLMLKRGEQIITIEVVREGAAE